MKKERNVCEEAGVVRGGGEGQQGGGVCLYIPLSSHSKDADTLVRTIPLLR